MREKSGRARKREDESPSVGGGRKSARRKKDEGVAGAAEGYAVERWWIEEGRGRVGSGVEGLPGWRYRERGRGGAGGAVRREGGRGEGLRGWKTHPFSCLPSLAV